MANRIHDIEIKNFKSIRHARIEDCRRVNVFIGYPNVGKSNILEALSLYSIQEKNNFNSFIKSDNSTTLFFNGNIDKPIEVSINKSHRYEAEYSNDRLRFSHYFYKKVDYGNGIGIRTDVDTVVQFELTENKISSFSKYNNISKEDSIPEIKKYKFSEAIIYIDTDYDKLIQPYGENIFKIISTNETIRKEVSELFRVYDLRFSFDKSTRTFKILKIVGDDIFLIPYLMIADTLQRVIFYKTAILSNKSSVLLFEEPEAHMFPPYMSKFTSDVVYDKNNNQFFITTHSPFVLNDFMEDLEKEDLAIYAVGYKKETGETVIRRITDNEINEIYQHGIDLFFNLENFLKDAV